MYKIIRVDFDTAKRLYVTSRDDRKLAFEIVILANKATRMNDAPYYYTVEEPK
jgi:hypothetical protein